jgi:hypothetical protein
MHDHVAGPGELTCIEENCPVSGLRQPDGRSACPECGTELARMPSAVAGPAPAAGTYPPLPRAVDSRSGWQRRSPLFRIGAAVGAVALVWLVSFVARNPDALHRVTGAGYAVGDCVRVEQGFRDADMKKADCGSAGDSLLSGDPVYRVAAVEKGKDAFCPGGGFDHITFSNEPEDRTYCLVIR